MFFRNRSFKIKIFVLIFFSIFLPSVMLTTMNFKRSETVIIDQAIRSVTSTTNNSVRDIDSKLVTVLEISNQMFMDSDVMDIIQKEKKFTKEEKNVYYPRIYKTLNSFISRIKAPNILAAIDSYYLYIPSQNVIITSNSTYYENADYKNVSFISKGSLNGNSSYWYTTKPINYETLTGRDVKQRLITYNTELKNKDGKVVGIYALNINKSLLNDVYSDGAGGIPNSFLVFDKNMDIIDDNKARLFSDADKDTILLKLSDKYAGNRQMQKNGNFITKIGNEEYIVVFSLSSYTEWNYVVLTKSNDVLQHMHKIRNFMILSLCLSVILILILTFFISKVFYNPIHKLVIGMHAVENRDLDFRIDDNRQDEYRLVYSGFNNMAAELKELIKNLTTQKMLNKEARIKLLQEQINPHFLYNTLDSIYSIAKIQNVPEIANMVYALSKFFRVSLSGGKDMVTLREAINIVESYLTVQNIRFHGKFVFSVEVGEELLGIIVPKLILQPIVENAIYHGIEKNKNVGHLKITADNRDETIILTISDDGAGMGSEKLEEIRQSLQGKNSNDKNFAIINLNTQIKLLYGESYGISIESELNKGTDVHIAIPKNHNQKIMNAL